MCAILGFIGHVREGQWRQTHELTRQLFLASEVRGKDATGFVALTQPLDHPYRTRTIVEKQPVPASEFVGTNPAFLGLLHRRCSALAGHCRWATHGDPEANINNHPMIGKHGLYLAHNGIVDNHREIADKHALRLESECDSECLLRLIEATRGSVAYGLERCLNEVKGSMAVAVFDARSGLMWLCRNHGRPLWLARLKHDRRWFFASTGKILLEAFKQVFGPDALHKIDYLAPIAEDSPLAIASTGQVIAPLAGPS